MTLCEKRTDGALGFLGQRNIPFSHYRKRVPHFFSLVMMFSLWVIPGFFSQEQSSPAQLQRSGKLSFSVTRKPLAWPESPGFSSGPAKQAQVLLSERRHCLGESRGASPRSFLKQALS